ncbi:MAG: hypothetical protein GY757_54225 [bacterium]|nr:hypothetical protein [bacterium]
MATSALKINIPSHLLIPLNKRETVLQKEGNDVFLVEAKWHSKPIARADLAAFRDKVTGKALGTRRLFFSISGFSEDGLEAFAKGNPTQIFGFDKADLEYVLDGKMTLPAAISMKIRHAGETNELFKPLALLNKKKEE